MCVKVVKQVDAVGVGCSNLFEKQKGTASLWRNSLDVHCTRVQLSTCTQLECVFDHVQSGEIVSAAGFKNARVFFFFFFLLQLR